MSKTEKNLEEAFTGESRAYQKYLIYAQKAADDYQDGVYKLFMALAASEAVHARRHLSYLKKIQGTWDNVQDAVESEAKEFETLYPRMISEAREEGEEGPEISFSHASEVEKGHHRLLGKALVEQDKFLVEEYFVCNACGHVVTREPPEYCQVCGAARKAFHKVI